MNDRISIMMVAILLFVFVKKVHCQDRIYGVSKEFDVEELNTLVQKELGESLVTKGIMTVREAIKITKSPSFKIDLIRKYPYGKGDILVLHSENKKWRFYYNSIGEEKFGAAISKLDGTVVRPIWGKTRKKVDGFEVEKTEYISYGTEYFMQEFIYNGKTDNNLKFLYREYIDDNARPSFSQEIQYDLEESNIIGFKGLRLEVVNITNTLIEYKILQSFNKR